jgi:predicted Zn-dependent protease
MDNEMTEMTQLSSTPGTAAENLYDEGIKRYQAGESPETLIPLFKDICEQKPKSSTSWTCLAWLYLLTDKTSLAYKAAKKGVKLNPDDAQARINLAVAMLEVGQKGVREQVEMAQQLMTISTELQQEVVDNIADGLQRKPDWVSLNRIQKWLGP